MRESPRRGYLLALSLRKRASRFFLTIVPKRASWRRMTSARFHKRTARKVISLMTPTSYSLLSDETMKRSIDRMNNRCGFAQRGRKIFMEFPRKWDYSVIDNNNKVSMLTHAYWIICKLSLEMYFKKIEMTLSLWTDRHSRHLSLFDEETAAFNCTRDWWTELAALDSQFQFLVLLLAIVHLVLAQCKPVRSKRVP